MKFKTRDTFLTLEEIAACEISLPQEYLDLAQTKLDSLMSTFGKLTFEQRCAYEKLLHLGYLAAHCTSDEEEELLIKLSPLGKALK